MGRNLQTEECVHSVITGSVPKGYTPAPITTQSFTPDASSHFPFSRASLCSHLSNPYFFFHAPSRTLLAPWSTFHTDCGWFSLGYWCPVFAVQGFPEENIPCVCKFTGRASSPDLNYMKHGHTCNVQHTATMDEHCLWCLPLLASHQASRRWCLSSNTC